MSLDAQRPVLWMPAHCRPDMVGVKNLSDGSTLTEVQRIGNDAVDHYAKKIPKENAPPKHQREAVEAATNSLFDIAAWIGVRQQLPGAAAPHHPREQEQVCQRLDRQRPSAGKDYTESFKEETRRTPSPEAPW